MAKLDKYEDVVVGLDFGTTKICAVVCVKSGNEPVEVIGVGKSPSHGIRKGVVINIESTVESIREAISEAERMAGVEISSVFAGIAGGHIKGFNSQGMVAIKNSEITKHDVNRVIEAAKAVAMPQDREVIHIIPQEFIVDDQDGIKDPVGMSGVRLETKVHMVTGAVTSAQNVVKCAQKAGLEVEDIILEPLASAAAVLSDDEKELGVALVDIGGGTTDVALFSGGSIVHSYVLPLGGNHITNDIAVGLRTPVLEAERIKIKYGCSDLALINAADTITVPGVGGRKPQELSRSELVNIIEPRVSEILTLVRQEMYRSGFFGLMASGIVISGGCSLLPGMDSLCEQIFNMPVKPGRPKGFGGLADIVNSPIYSTGVGLGLCGFLAMGTERPFRRRESGVYDNVRDRMKAWFSEIF